MEIDWKEIFAIETHFMALVLRATFLYLGILFLLRLLPRRTGGEVAPTDLVFVVLIVEGASHALGDYTSVTEGFIVICTFLAWNYFLNFLSYHVPFVEKLLFSPPLLIIKNGKIIRKNLRKEYLTNEELYDQLRKEGIEDINEIKTAHVESDGKISFIKKGE